MLSLDYICFNAYNGYSTAARNYILALHGSGQYNVRVTPLDAPDKQKRNEDTFSLLNSLAKNNNRDSQIQIYHCVPDMQRRVKRKMFTAGFAVFEAETPPQHWIDILNMNDIILTPSKFNFKTFSELCEKPVYYVPHCFDVTKYNTGVKPLLTSDSFTFMFIGAWKLRKGYKSLLRAWFEEFTIKDNVKLIIKTDKPLMAQQEIAHLQQEFSDFAPIKVWTENVSDDEWPSFIKSANCLVQPSLGEGFNLPGLHACALGVPLIITNYSGCTDYAREGTATLLQPEGFVKIPLLDNIPQFRNCSWAHISVKQIREKMRFVFSNQLAAKIKAAEAYKLVHNNFSYQRVISYFNEAFLDVEVMQPSRQLIGV